MLNVHVAREGGVLTVGLGDTLQLVLLLDGVAVARALGGVDELVRQTLGDGLDVAERCLTGTSAQQPDSLVDATERRHVNGLSTHCALPTDTRRVLARTRVAH